MIRSAAIDELTTAFERGAAQVGHTPADDRDLIVASWPSVPIEIIRASRLRLMVARGSAAPTPTADAYLETGVFPSRLAHLVEATLTGRLSHISRTLIPRTSDPDYKCFLYLREFARVESVKVSLPPVMLFDLLQSYTAGVGTYVTARTRNLLDDLGRVSGHPATIDVLHDEIVRTNAARAAARRLIHLRHDTPHVTGTQVLPLLGAFWQMAPDRYAVLANAAAATLVTAPPLTGPRLLLAGAPVDSPHLHGEIESHGAVVVDEVSPWGGGMAGADVRLDGDPVAALADKYRTDALTSRLPADDIRRWIERALASIDGVVVSLPPDDAVFGWDYPGMRDALNATGVPHARLDGSHYAPLTPEEHDRIDALVTAASRRREGSVG